MTVKVSVAPFVDQETLKYWLRNFPDTEVERSHLYVTIFLKCATKIP